MPTAALHTNGHTTKVVSFNFSVLYRMISLHNLVRIKFNFIFHKFTNQHKEVFAFCKTRKGYLKNTYKNASGSTYEILFPDKSTSIR